MNYPKVMSEAATLSAAQTNSLARFGDGELSLALGGNCISQVQVPALQKERRRGVRLELYHPARLRALDRYP
jgi:hypothetical protein